MVEFFTFFNVTEKINHLKINLQHNNIDTSAFSFFKEALMFALLPF